MAHLEGFLLGGEGPLCILGFEVPSKPNPPAGALKSTPPRAPGRVFDLKCRSCGRSRPVLLLAGDGRTSKAQMPQRRLSERLLGEVVSMCVCVCLVSLTYAFLISVSGMNHQIATKQHYDWALRLILVACCIIFQAGHIGTGLGVKFGRDLSQNRKQKCTC